jgi:ammonia channel protein AmtB
VVLKGWFGLRVSREEEIKGLDIEEHGTEAYPKDLVNIPGIAD